MNSLVKEVEKIKMPDDMRKRIIKNCNNYIKSENHDLQENNRMQKEKQILQISKIQKIDKLQNRSMKEEKIRYKEKAEALNKTRKLGDAGMKRGQTNNRWKKQLPMAAALVLCVCVTGVTAMASTGKLQGFFKDITRWDGAVVGTAYEQATEEIAVSIEEVSDELNILVIIEEPEKPPYLYSELFGIASYRIEDMSGNVIISENSFGERTTFDSQMSFKIPLSGISNGKYKLVIEQFVSEKKADQPLGIRGNWECEFEY